MSLKKLLVLAPMLLALVASGAQAQALESQRLQFDGSRAVDNVLLNATESHTVYQTVTRPATCHRQELDGYENRCHTTSRYSCTSVYRQQCRIERVCNGNGPRSVCREQRVCRSIPDRVCRYVPDTVCTREPRYRQVAYSCSRTETVPVGQELDFHVAGAFDVNYGPVPQGIQANESLVLSLSNGVPALALERGSNQLLVYSVAQVAPVQIVRPDQGPQAPGEKRVAASFRLSFVSPSDVSSPVSQAVQGIAIEGNTLKFSVGRVVHPELLGVHVKIKRQKFLSDPLVVEDQIQAQDLMLKDQGARSEVNVALTRYLKEQIKDAKYDVEIVVSSQAPAANLLNAALLPQQRQVEGKAEVNLKN